MTQVLTPKEKIAETLFNETTANFPSKLITEILTRISDERVSEITTYRPYNHDAGNILEACGLTENDVKSFTDKFTEYMASDEVSKLSEGIEFVENSDTSRRILAYWFVNLSHKKVEQKAKSLDIGDLSKLADIAKTLAELKKKSEGSDE